MGSKWVDEVLDAAGAGAGVHYSALRLEELDIQGSMSGQEQPTTSGLENGHREPFVIGVAGGASSGVCKSTVCKMIIDQLRDQRVVVVTQSAVASLVSDENVWDAVLKNKEVKEFCKTHQQKTRKKIIEELGDEQLNP